ncbi:hypothetical protein WI30_20380 [Burkholderia ubonensis]|nr:hypothetical protein WI30_20380 [Burkholderia ubonensis]
MRIELKTADHYDPNAVATIEGTLTNMQFDRANGSRAGNRPRPRASRTMVRVRPQPSRADAGRLLAEMMTGETPFTDPSPYRADRF